MQYWLLKSEPTTFSIDDLIARPHQIEPWNGVRNYQARNMLRDQMQLNDLAFFYHSSCAEPGIVGIVEIVKAGYPEYDQTSRPDKPRWYQVDVKFREKFQKIISLHTLKQQPTLKTMRLLQKGNRLSILPISKTEWETILALKNL